MYKLNEIQNQRNFFFRAKTRLHFNTEKNIVQVQQLPKKHRAQVAARKKNRAKKIRATPHQKSNGASLSMMTSLN